MSGVFHFKRFSVDQSGCSMKINTDGVLLGAIAEGDDPRRILDVGTGTGVIALMLAQRYPDGHIEAIEIDEQAAATATRNFRHSPFANRMVCFPVGLSDFLIEKPFDLIVSNPPYYLNSLKNPDYRKSVARHADIDFFEQLLRFANKGLTKAGSLQLVLPANLADGICQLAEEKFGFVCQWRVVVRSFVDDTPIRQIIALGKTKVRDRISEFVIYDTVGQYSEVYRTVLKNFFLAF